MTPTEIEKIITDSGITIEDGQAYNLYDCGCVFNSAEDPSKVKHNSKTSQRTRCCPVCTSDTYGFLLTKYKRCKCGYVHTGYRVIKSEYCVHCPKENRIKAQNLAKNKFKYSGKTLRNEDQCDPERWDCLFRDNCYIEYAKHDAIPCKNCELYQKNYGALTDVQPRESFEDEIMYI